MKTSYAVLAATTVGVARPVRSERQNRQRAALHAEEIHQEWISDVTCDPELGALWTAPGEPSAEEYELLHCNRLISFLPVKFPAALLNIPCLMGRDVGRTYWALLGAFPEEDAVDRIDRTFHAVMADEHAGLVAVNAVAA